jgi:hypothetical protein
MQTWPNLHDPKPVRLGALIYVAVLSVLSAVAMNPTAVLVLTLAAMPAIALALIPGLVSQHLANAYTAAHTLDDFVVASAARPAVLEIIRDDRGIGRPGNRATLTACDIICQHVLFSGEVERLRVTALPSPDRRESTTYRLQPDETCPRSAATMRGGPLSRPRLPQGMCLITEDLDDTPPEATVSIITERAADAAKATSFYFQPGMIQRLDIQAGGASVRRETQIDARVLTIPFRITLEGRREVGVGGPIAARHTTTLSGWNLTDALRASFDFMLDPFALPPAGTPQ